MIKILFFIPTLGHGGAERVLTNLVNHMDRDRFQITVQTMFDTGIYRDKLRKDVRYIGGFPWYFHGNTLVYRLFSPELLYRMYIREDYDIIVSYLEGPSARVVAGGRASGAKKICWIHIQLESRKYVARAFRSMKEAEACYQQFDRLICVSKAVQDSLQKMIPVSVPTEVLMNTVMTEEIIEQSQEPNPDAVFRKDEINVISVAKLMKVKGFDRLARIQKKLRDQGYPVHVYVAGSGEEEENLKKQVRELGLQNCWTFLGFQKNPFPFVRAADLYVCSSWREGISTAVTEALIIGTPVVSTDCAGARELLGENNEYGIVTENTEESLYDGLLEMLSDPERLSHYRQMAAARGKMFHTENTVKEVERMLLEVWKQ